MRAVRVELKQSCDIKAGSKQMKDEWTHEPHRDWVGALGGGGARASGARLIVVAKSHYTNNP
jgi:hypothetical protein